MIKFRKKKENNSEDIFDFFSLYRMGIFHIVSVKENTLGD